MKDYFSKARENVKKYEEEKNTQSTRVVRDDSAFSNRTTGTNDDYLRSLASNVASYDGNYSNWKPKTVGLNALKEVGQQLSASQNRLKDLAIQQSRINTLKLGGYINDDENNSLMKASQSSFGSNLSKDRAIEAQLRDIKRLNDMGGEKGFLSQSTLEESDRRLGYLDKLNSRLKEIDNEINALSATVRYGVGDSKASQISALKAERDDINNALILYKHSGNKQYDDDRAIVNASDYQQYSQMRNFGNPDIYYSNDVRDRADASQYTYDYNGNLVNSKGEIVDPNKLSQWRSDWDNVQSREVNDKLGLYLNTPEEERKEALQNESLNVIDSAKKAFTDGDYFKWNYLTDDEIGTYYYKMNKNGREEAYKYLDSLSVLLSKRHQDEEDRKLEDEILTLGKLEQMKADGASDADIMKAVNQHTQRQLLSSLISVPENIIGGPVAGVSAISDFVQGRELNPYNQWYGMLNNATKRREVIATELAQNTGSELLGDLYNSAMSTADSAVGGLALGPIGYGASMGLGATASRMKELYEEGATDSQIFWGGVASGIFESVFESWSLEKLLKPGEDPSKFLLNVLKSMGAEGSEEMATDIANNIWDVVVRGNESELLKNYRGYLNEGYSEGEASMKAFWDDAKGIIKSGVFGAISGGMFGTVSSGYQKLNYNNTVMNEGSRINNSKNNETLGNLSKYVEKFEASDKKAQTLLEKAQKAQKNLESNNNNKNQTRYEKAVGQLSEYLNRKLTNTNTAYVSDIVKENTSARGENLEQLTEAVMVKALGGENESINRLIEKNNISSDVLASVREYLIKTETERSGARRGIEYDENGKATAESVREYYKAITKDETERLSKMGAESIALESDGDGITSLKESGEKINIKDIHTVGSEGLQLETDDGRIVRANDVSFGSDADAVILGAIQNMQISTAEANELWRSFDPSKTSAELYALGINEAYTYGRINVNALDDYRTMFVNSLPTEIAQRAFNIGKISKQTEVSNQTLKIKELAKLGVNNTSGNLNVGNVTFAPEDTEKGQRQRDSVEALSILSDALGVKFNLFEGYRKDDGKLYAMVNGKEILAPNGYFNPNNSEMWIDINADGINSDGTKGEGYLLYTSSHEITHFIKMWSPEKYEILKNFLNEYYKEKGISVTALVNEQMAKNMRAGNNISREQAHDEVVSDSMQRMLADKDLFSKVFELKSRDKSLVEKISEWLNKTAKAFEKVAKSYEGSKEYTLEGRTISEMTDKLEELRSIFAEALVDASDNFVKAGGVDLTQYMGAKNKSGNQLFQVKAFINDEENYKQILKQYNVMSDSEITNLFNTLDKAEKLILDNLDVLDFAYDENLNEDGDFDDTVDSRVLKTYKANSDKLYQISLDFSTLCRKRILQQIVQFELQAKLGRNISQAESIAIRKELQMLKAEGLDIEVACGLCYVESARLKTNNQIAKFLADPADVVSQFFGGMSAKDRANEAERNKRIELNERQNSLPEDQKYRYKNGPLVGQIIDFTAKTASLNKMPDAVADEIREVKKAVKKAYQPNEAEAKIIKELDGLTVNDFTKPEGLTELKRNHPEIYEAYTSYVRNASKAKGIEGDTFYRFGDADSISDTLIDRMNAENGLRSQSWSDFQVIHLMDYIASVIELSTRGAKMQAYTKVPDFVELMGLTGEMINLSLIPTAEFNGKLEYDPVEGMPFEKALELRDKYPWTAGTICIGESVKQIQMLLESLDIDYVIPYHHSGNNQHMRSALGIPQWKSFQSFQSETNLDSVPKGYTKDTANWHKHPNFSDWFNYEEASKIQKAESKHPTRPDLAKKYGVMYGGYMAMHQMAENYKRICYERGLAPKFSQSNTKLNGNFTEDFNYWKLLIDRKMINQKNGEIINQKAVKPIFSEENILGILNRELERYGRVKAHQDYAVDSISKMFEKGLEDGSISREGNFAKNSSNTVEKDAEKIAKALRNPIRDITEVNAIANGTEVLKDGIEPVKEFSVKGSNYQDNGTLFAVHNQTIDEFVASLELGGFPAPSIAVIKRLMGHSKFGNVSVIFDKNTIDPQADKRNKVYSGDAYTPTFPRVDYEVDTKKMRAVGDKLDDLYKKATNGNPHTLPSVTFYQYQDGISDIDTLMYQMTNNEAVKMAYLYENVEGYEPEYKAKSYGSFSADTLQRYLDLSNISDLDERATQALKDTVPLYNKRGINPLQVTINNLISRAMEFENDLYSENGVDAVLDERATTDKYKSELEGDKYKNWVEELVRPFIGDKYLDNGKGIYTDSGNRRTFAQRHMAYTLENIVRRMAMEDSKGIASLGTNIVGASAKSFKSIDEIKSREGQLRIEDEGMFFDKQRDFFDRLHTIADKIDTSGYYYVSTGDIIAKAVSKSNTKAQLANNLRKEAGDLKYPSSIVDDIWNLVKDIQAMPTGYFEAKPMRAVYANEIKMVIMPDNAPIEVIRMMEEQNIPYTLYEAGNENDRLAKMNSENLDNLAFSVREQEDSYLDLAKDPIKNKEALQSMVDAKADEYLNTLLLPNDDDVEGFKYHRGKAPTKTFKRYAVLNVTEDGLKPAYAGNKASNPIGVWLDAQNLKSYMSDVTQLDDGTFATYIPGDTGTNWKAKFSEDLYNSYGLGKGQKWLLERGGKHSSDVANFSQMNLKQDENGNKVKSAKDGALPHNKLVFEIEYGMSDDGDLTEFVKENGRKINGQNQGLANIQPNQYYDFKTNPNAVGNWGIGGTFRIVRLVPMSEIIDSTIKYKQNALKEAKALLESGQISKKDYDTRIKGANALNVQKWVGGYHPEDFGLTVKSVDQMYRDGVKMKLTDAVTYDDNGNVIPLSQRFNPEVDDLRYSVRDFSDRELLIEALSKISGEKSNETLQSYKDKLTELRQYEEDLNVATSEMYRMKKANPKDYVAIKSMEARIDGIRSKISTADEALLKIQKLKPIRDIIERQRNEMNEMYEQHIKELRNANNAKTKELREAYDAKRIKDIEKIRNANDAKIKELREAYAKRIKDIKDSYMSKMDDIVQKNRESRHTAVVKRNATKLRNAIKGDISKLNQYLNRGNDKKNVKEDLKDIVNKSLATFSRLMNAGEYQSDLDIVRGLDREKYSDLSGAIDDYIKYSDIIAQSSDPKEIDKAKYQLGKIRPKLRDVIVAEREIANRETVGTALTALSEAYSDIKKSDKSYIVNAYSEDVAQMIRNLKDEIGGTVIKDASVTQLKSIHDVLRAITHTVTEANKLFRMEKYESVLSASSDAIKQITQNAVSKLPKSPIGETLSRFRWNNLKPIYAFERIGSEVMTDLFKQIRNAEDTWVVNISKAKSYFQSMADKYDYDSWNFDELSEFKDAMDENRTFNLTLGQMMSIYAYSRRGEQAVRHLTMGGIVYDPNTEFKIGKKKVKVNDAEAYHLDIPTLDAIRNQLTDKQRRFAEEMQNYLSFDMAELGNQTSMDLLGIKLFNEGAYFPLQSSRMYNLAISDDGADVPVRVKSYGFTKNLTPNASNAIVLNDFMSVWSQHCNEMSMYNAFTMPLENFRKVYNFKTTASEDSAQISLQASLMNAQGRACIDYINQLINDINGGARMDPRSDVFGRLMSKFKMTAVAMNLQVVLQQPSAIGRALSMIDAKYFIPSDIKTNYGTALEEMNKYAPVSVIKDMGYFDTDMGMTSDAFIREREVKGLANKSKKFINDSDYRADVMNNFTGWLPGKADEMTWIAMWKATKRMVADQKKYLKVGSEAYMKAVGEAFTDMIIHTQVYDSVLSRSANMRSKDGAMKMITAFMAEPTTTANMVEQAITKLKSDPKVAVKMLGSVAVSITLNSLLKAITSGARDKDEDETYLEKYTEAFVDGMLDGFNPLTYLPYVKDVWSLVQGFDVERSDMSLISEVVDKVSKFKSALKSTAENREEKIAQTGLDVGLAILNMFGVPVKSAYRDVSSIVNVFNTFNNGAKTTPKTFSKAILDTVKDYFGFLNFSPEAQKSDKLYDAIVGTDRELQRRLEQSYSSDSALESAIVKGLRENDPRIQRASQYRLNGDTKAYMDLAKQIIAEGNFSQDEVVKAINYYVNKANEDSNDSETTAKAKQMFNKEDFMNALVAGDIETADAVKDSIISINVQNGKTEDGALKTFTEAVPGYVKDYYINGSLSEEAVSDILHTYTEKSDEDIEKYILGWDFERRNGYSYSDINVAIEEGKISREDAINEMITYKGYDYEKAEKKVDYMIYQNNNPLSDLSEDSYAKYVKYIEPSGISSEIFNEFYEATNDIKADVDKNGKGISGSKQKKIVAIIDSLPISKEQKDALYYYCGYAQSTIKKVTPWR